MRERDLKRYCVNRTKNEKEREGEDNYLFPILKFQSIIFRAFLLILTHFYSPSLFLSISPSLPHSLSSCRISLLSFYYLDIHSLPPLPLFPPQENEVGSKFIAPFASVLSYNSLPNHFLPSPCLLTTPPPLPLPIKLLHTS